MSCLLHHGCSTIFFKYRSSYFSVITGTFKTNLAVRRILDIPIKSKSVLILWLQKGENPIFVQFDDICFGSGEDRKHKYYLTHMADWYGRKYFYLYLVLY